MTQADKIKLANDMAAENPDSTIRNYLDAVAEIEAIEASNNFNLKKHKNEFQDFFQKRGLYRTYSI